MKKLLFVALLLAVLAISPVVMAEDIFDPPWDASAERQTYQGWEFYTDANPIEAEIDENPYGTAILEMIGTWDSYGEEPGLDGTFTAWHVGPPSGKHSIQIKNDPNQGQRKEVWVQVTCSAPPISVGSPAAGSTTNPFPHHDWGNGWGTFPYLVTIPGNPPLEYIEIEFAECTWVEEIIIHTRCVPIPEPGLMALSGLGVLLFLRKRK